MAVSSPTSESSRQPKFKLVTKDGGWAAAELQRLPRGYISMLVWKAQTKKNHPQIRPQYHPEVESGLLNKRAMGNWIIQRKRLLQMRSR
jgi:hypothetical protein